ncbi:MAG TPA: long-chain fatty acid--CoA ligase [Candidatus Dormibacteraeota bacterium]
MTRAYDWIAHHARRTPGNLAAIDVDSGRRLTYAELDDRVSRLASHLGSVGVERGDRVAVLAPNSTDVFEIQFACWRLGALLNPLNWRLAPPELEFIAGDSEPKVLIHDREQAALAASLPGLKIERGGDDSAYERGIAAASRLERVATPNLDDVLCLLYTAGTTGRPKGALVTYGMTFWNAVNIGMAVELTSSSTALTVLPTFHTGGLNLYANPTFHLGGTVVVMRTFDPGQCLALLSDPELGVTHFFGVPANYLFLAEHPDFERADLSRLVATGLGGAPAPLSLLETWARRGCPLMQGYGMTETSPSAIVIGADQVIAKQGSCGLPVLHTEVRIVDGEGRDVATGEVGELWVRGPNVTPGYWRRPDASAESFTDSWLHTGDAARQDEDGYFYIVDRWKDMYISGGENVYPAEVENAIYALAGVSEAAVVGVPDERWGEVGCAFVVLRPGAELTEAEVIEHCRERLARYKVPKSVVFRDQPLPRNAAGKVLKRELGER